MEHYGVSDALFLLEGKIANQTPSVGGINMDTMLAWPHLSVFAAALKIYQCSERTPSTASKTLEHDAFSLLSLLLYSCRGDPCTFSALNLVKTASIVASVLRERLCLLATLSLTQIYADSYALVLIFRIANVELLISSSQLFLLSLHKLKLLSAIIGISFLIVLFAELFGFHSECSSRGAPEEEIEVGVEVDLLMEGGGGEGRNAVGPAAGPPRKEAGAGTFSYRGSVFVAKTTVAVEKDTHGASFEISGSMSLGFSYAWIRRSGVDYGDTSGGVPTPIWLISLHSLLWHITSPNMFLHKTALYAICAKNRLSEKSIPQLPSPDATMHERPTGKVGMYTRFFDYANYLDEFVVPANACFSWFLGLNIVKDRAPAPSEYNVEHVNTLIAQASPFLRFPEEFLCWVGISRNYLLNKDTYPHFVYEDGEGMDLNAFIRTADPRKVRIVERHIAENERPIVTVAKHRTVTLLSTSVVRSSGELSASVEREFARDASVGDGRDQGSDSAAVQDNVEPSVPAD
ncbi:hypothetical protein Tco_0247559 [Tanacetum coccineum]